MYLGLGCYAVGHLAIGIRGLVTNKPSVISALWSSTALLPLVVVGALESLVLLWQLEWIFSLVLLGLFFTVVIPLAATNHLQKRWYEACGFSDASFSEALRASLESLDVPYEKTESCIRFLTLEAELQLSSGMGLYKGLYVKRRQFTPALHDLVQAMDAYCRNSPGMTVSRKACMWQLVFGIAFLLTMVAASYLTVP